MAEHEPHNLPSDPEMESRLRSARPRPDAAFVIRLEADLFAGAHPSERQKRRFRWRPAFAAGLAVAAIAFLTLVFDLAGVGPFSDDEPVQAGNNCKTVVVTKRERQPVTKDGKIVFEYRAVKRHVKRCH